MGKHYLLPVGAVVEMMKALPDLMMLQAPLSSLPGFSKEACLAQIILGQGQVSSCTIVASGTGMILQEQPEAYQTLEQRGDLSWSVLAVPSVPSASSPTNLPINSPASQKDNVAPAGQYPSLLPTLRIKALTSDVLTPFSPACRRVLMLVDGQRTSEEIARLLHKEQSEVQQILTGLPHLIQFA